MKSKKNKTDNTNSWSALGQIYKLMFKHWIYVVGGLITMVLYASMNGASITMVVPVLDVVFKPRTKAVEFNNLQQLFGALSDRLASFFSTEFNLFHLNSLKGTSLLKDLKDVIANTDQYTILTGIGLFVIVIFLLKNLFFYSNKFMFTNLRGRTVRDIRSFMFSRYLSQSLAFFNNNRIGDSIVRMINDVDIVSIEFISNLFICLRDLLVMVSCLFVAYYMNPRLFFISILITPVFAFSIGFLGRKIRKYAKRIQMQYSSMFSSVEEALSSMRIVKSFSREDHELNVFKKINNRYRQLWQKTEMYSALTTPISEMSSALIGVVLLFVAGNDIMNPNSGFTLGKFTAFMVAVFATLHPMKTLTKAYTDIKKALVSLDRISFILSMQTEVVEHPNAVAKEDFSNNIEFKQVGFSYKAEKMILQDISFEIKKGERIAIVGSSGSGKTTLVNLLNRMYDYQAGQILIDSIPITEIKLKDLRSMFGVVPQESMLFSNTIEYNIQYGNRKAISLDDVKYACKIANATEFIEQYPDTYSHLLQTKASDLSGGQKQRLCIARAIAANPPILIFDEATSALDSESEMKVQDAIEKATQNRTVIIIAHRLTTIVNCDKIVVLEKGSIVGFGSHDELMKSNERYQTLNKIQFRDIAKANG